MNLARLLPPFVTAPPAPRLWGVLAEFESVDVLLPAVEKVREAGFAAFDVHTPIPIHGLDEAMGIRSSRIPLVVLGGGVAGAAAGLALQWWTNAVAYPFKISGKPLFGLPAAIPIAFELTVLLASLGAVVALVVANGWPMLYHPLLKVERFRRASRDRFFVSIEAADPRFDLAAVTALLSSLGASAVETVEE